MPEIEKYKMATTESENFQSWHKEMNYRSTYMFSGMTNPMKQ